MKTYQVIAEDALLTGTLNIAGTDSFRAASSKVFNRYGLNIQNAPEVLRSCVIARPGCLLAQTDQGGAEARATAYESNCAALIRCFEADIKPYIPMALNVFVDKFRGKEDRKRYFLRDPLELKQLPEWPELSARIKKDKEAYPLGKMAVLAFNYGMGWPTFQTNVLKTSSGAIRLDNKMVKFIRDTYFAWCPELLVWHCMIEKTIRDNGVLYNMHGHPRIIEYMRFTTSEIRAAISWIPQSTIGEISHRAAVAMKLEVPDARMWLHTASNIHDALLTEFPEDKKDTVLAVMEKHLGPWLLTTDLKRRFKMAVESKVGKSWYVPQ